MVNTLDEWINEVDAYMLRHYFITITADAGVSQEELARAMSDGDTPKEYCEWFAEKYDLDSRTQLRANWIVAD